MTTDRMKIRPENLAAAATDSTATQAARAPVTIASPPPAAAGSPVDAAAVAVGTTIQAALAGADTADVAAGFQESVADVLTAKAVRAATDVGVDTLLIAGGVAANSRLRELAEERCAAAGLTLRVPRPRLCTDNGAMIASFAAHLVAAGAQPSPLQVASDPGLPVLVGQVV